MSVELAHAGHWLTTPGSVAGVATAVAASLAWQRPRTAGAYALLSVTAALVSWGVLVTTGVHQPAYLWVTLFSALALLLSTSLIHTALRTDDVPALAFGILFGLAFVIVRWTSVIENMLWSGLMLLVAGGGLLIVARLWRQRHRPLAIAGRAQ